MNNSRTGMRRETLAARQGKSWIEIKASPAEQREAVAYLTEQGFTASAAPLNGGVWVQTGPNQSEKTNTRCVFAYVERASKRLGRASGDCRRRAGHS